MMKVVINLKGCLAELDVIWSRLAKCNLGVGQII